MHQHSQIFCVIAAISVLLLLQNIDLNRFIAKCLKFYIKNTKKSAYYFGCMFNKHYFHNFKKNFDLLKPTLGMDLTKHNISAAL